MSEEGLVPPPPSLPGVADVVTSNDEPKRESRGLFQNVSIDPFNGASWYRLGKMILVQGLVGILVAGCMALLFFLIVPAIGGGTGIAVGAGLSLFIVILGQFIALQLYDNFRDIKPIS